MFLAGDDHEKMILQHTGPLLISPCNILAFWHPMGWDAVRVSMFESYSYSNGIGTSNITTGDEISLQCH